jgi:cysteine desulfurase
MKQIYLDNAATTKVDENVIKEMEKYHLKEYGNASSIHQKGIIAKKALEEARKTIAKSINAKPNEIIFTSSGTESNNFALKGLFYKNFPNKNHIITTTIEHDCILKTCKFLETIGAKITYLEVNKEGFIDLNSLKKEINEKTFLVSVIHANNEIGTIQEIRKIGKICKEKKVYFHSDICQSYTKEKIDVHEFNLDLTTLNAHKIHGPKGIGALYIKEKIKIEPLLHGGGHENNLRSSTQNIPSIIGFAKAVENTLDKKNNLKKEHLKKIKKIKELRDYFIKEILKIEKTFLNGPTGKKRICNNINIGFSNIEGESLQNYLNQKGIFASSGSACSSYCEGKSHVLKAIGLDHLKASTSLRFSLSKYTTKKEIDYTIKNIKLIVNKLRKLSPIK